MSEFIKGLINITILKLFFTEILSPIYKVILIITYSTIISVYQPMAEGLISLLLIEGVLTITTTTFVKMFEKNFYSSSSLLEILNFI